MPDTPTGPARQRPVRRVLTDLVNVDGTLRALTAEMDALQDSPEIRELEQDVATLRRSRAAADLAAADDAAKQRRRHQDAAKLRARRRDDISSLGAEVDTERRRDLKHDLVVAERRLAEIEKAIADHGTATVSDGGQDQELDAAVAALEAARGRRADRERELTGQVTSLREHSFTLRAELPEQLLRRYERGERENGVGAASLVGSSCRACFMGLDRASVAEILTAPKDAPGACPECGTMLLPEADAYTEHVDRSADGTGRTR